MLCYECIDFVRKELFIDENDELYLFYVFFKNNGEMNILV